MASGKNQVNLKMGGVSHFFSTTASLNLNASNRLSVSYDGTWLIGCVNGACTSSSQPGLAVPTFTTIYVSNTLGTLSPQGTVKDICVDTTSGGCR